METNNNGDGWRRQTRMAKMMEANDDRNFFLFESDNLELDPE
jgi:hypothetical protein